MSTIQTDIERLLSEREPEVEVLLAELNGDAVELYIDHPEGVTLALCERVTHALPEILEAHALTVSSPGIERPLSKPEHFRRFIGRRARVRTQSTQLVRWSSSPSGSEAQTASIRTETKSPLMGIVPNAPRGRKSSGVIALDGVANTKIKNQAASPNPATLADWARAMPAIPECSPRSEGPHARSLA